MRTQRAHHEYNGHLATNVRYFMEYVLSLCRAPACRQGSAFKDRLADTAGNGPNNSGRREQVRQRAALAPKTSGQRYQRQHVRRGDTHLRGRGMQQRTERLDIRSLLHQFRWQGYWQFARQGQGVQVQRRNGELFRAAA